ncbi:syntaxin-8 isoform X5 [Bubalus kerabau]|uniref:syntaxin-8 isoform X5 n=1 Tax=Bubalus carabanensis TaxID=3119969 RepID=UPI00244EC06F|nr:syntaxin-8 isoform X5 [Bubalus carabanensis]
MDANWSSSQSPGKRFPFSRINRLEALGFSTYDSTCQIAQEIAEKIQQRNQYERNGENTTKLTVTIRALLQKLKEKIALLKDLLLRAVATHQITQLEGDRRQNLLDDLVTRERLLLASFKNEGAEPDLIRSSLMTGGAKRGAPNPWLLEEPEETRGLGFDEIRQQQQKIIQEQDAGLDALSSIISRQKQMGQEIGNELDEQNAQHREGDIITVCQRRSPEWPRRPVTSPHLSGTDMKFHSSFLSKEDKVRREKQKALRC